MARVISFVNNKGGVGKTTTCASVGGILAQRGFRVLLADLDSQANLTFSLKPEAQFGRTVCNAFRERRDIPVVRVRENLSLVPSAMFFAGIDILIRDEISRECILKDLLSPVKGEYDVILIDCPPNVGLVTINALAASDDVIVPVTAEALPLQGLAAIEEFIGLVRERISPLLSFSGVLVCKWQGRKLNRMVEETLRGKYGSLVFNTKIRDNIIVAEAPFSRRHIYEYSGKSRAARDYSDFADEMTERFALAPEAAQTAAENGNTVTR